MLHLQITSGTTHHRPINRYYYICATHHPMALASMNMIVFKTRFLMKPLITLFFFAVVHLNSLLCLLNSRLCSFYTEICNFVARVRAAKYASRYYILPSTTRKVVNFHQKGGIRRKMFGTRINTISPLDLLVATTDM